MSRFSHTSSPLCRRGADDLPHEMADSSEDKAWLPRSGVNTDALPQNTADVPQQAETPRL
jgi:hypothetical protein